MSEQEIGKGTAILPTGWKPAHASVAKVASPDTANRADKERTPILDSLVPNTRIGQYEIIRPLAEGGMGRVYLARDTKLARKVAIKFLLADSGGDTNRFVVEARATARCSHENIVVIHEVGQHCELPFMILEYLDGSDLQTRIENRAVGPQQALEVLVPTVRALKHAHSIGIVHCDLKPANIFVTKSGWVKVLDFGIAKILRGRRAHTEDSVANEIDPDQLTTLDSGQFIGSLPYMAPEQLQHNEAVDHRTDLWALGVMLYQLACGKHPLEDLNAAEMHEAIGGSSTMPALPTLDWQDEQIRSIVDKCMQKSPASRYQSAAALLEDLERASITQASSTADELPYAGLATFSKADASKFHGRSRETAALAAKVREFPLVGVIGPSGAGKSSVVRAGLMATAAMRNGWIFSSLRPGRSPLASLARTIQKLGIDTGESIEARMSEEPGTFGALLRAHAQESGKQILLFCDQFEELFTLCSSSDERSVFLKALHGAGDASSSPIRVVFTLRSDFLDRLADADELIDELQLMFLGPLDSSGLRSALTAPATAANFEFEEGLVDEILDDLKDSANPLPVLQFCASELWSRRDTLNQLLRRDVYLEMGRIGGALARHADETLSAVSSNERDLARELLMRLVTPARSRAVIELSDLRAMRVLGQADPLIERFVAARLLSVRSDGEASYVELVHESLISEWPTLSRWLKQGAEDSAFRKQLRLSASQWQQKGRIEGLLWREDALDEAKRWHRQSASPLPDDEQEYLNAVLALGRRTATRARRRIGLVIVVLLSLLAAASFALFYIDRQRNEVRSANHRLVEINHELEEETRARQLATKQALDADREKEKAAKRARDSKVIAAQATEQADDADKRANAIKAGSKRLARKAADAAKRDSEAAHGMTTQQLREAHVALKASQRKLSTVADNATRLREEAEAKTRLARLALARSVTAEKNSKRLNAALETRLKRERATKAALEKEYKKISRELK